MSDSNNEEFINILVLGSSNIRISYFIKLFGFYLKYSTSDEVMFYEPNLKSEVKNVEETTRNTITIGKHIVHFIDTPGLQKSGTNYKEIIDILLHFTAVCRLQAIILLIKPDRKGNENYFEQCTTHFFSGLKQYKKNIMFVVIDNNDLSLSERILLCSELNITEMNNLFYLNENSYYTLSDCNWEESVNVSRDIFERITGNDLKSFYVQCVMPPEESFLNLIHNLNAILLLVCFLEIASKTELKQIYIKEYQGNTTVCFGINCQTVKEIERCVFRQICPKICHKANNCNQSILDVESCSVFKAGRCSVCNCNVDFHRSFLVMFDSSTRTSIMKHEQSIAKSTLNKLMNCYDSISINDFISKALAGASQYTEDILREIEGDVEKYIKTHAKTRLDNLLPSIRKLYEIKELTRVFPEVINENFPEGLRLEINSELEEQQNKTNESRSCQLENYIRKTEVDEFEQMLNTTSSNQSKMKNVLVLGTTNVRTSQFCKLFEAYLSYNSYEEASRWHSNLDMDDGIERPLIFVNNLHLFCTPDLDDTHISKQIISILVNFKEKQSLSAIIILINPNNKYCAYVGKLRSYLFHILNEFSDNVLYIYALNDDFYKSAKCIKNEFDVLEIQKRNVFHCNWTTFYNATAANWQQSMKFCKIISNYIIGKGNNCGLETIYIDTKISDKLVLNLITNLTELLILIYICINAKGQCIIGEVKKNITVCYGNRCAQTTEFCMMKMVSSPPEYLIMKTPKICHSFCNCIEADINISKCMVFEELDKICMQCKCKIELHSQYYFKIFKSNDINQQQLNNEKQIIINILATMYIFKKQNQESLNSENIFSKFLNIEDKYSKIIFDLFKNEFNQKVEEIETKRQPITKKDVMICLNSLYEIKASTLIIPKFMEGIFPKNIQLQTITNGSRSLNKTKTLKALEVDDKLEIKMLKNKVAKLEVLINKILNSNKDNATEKNGNKLDSQSNQEATASSSNVNLD